MSTLRAKHFMQSLIALLLCSFYITSYALISNNSCSSGKAKSSGCHGGNEVGGDPKNDASCCSKAIAVPRDLLNDKANAMTIPHSSTKTVPIDAKSNPSLIPSTGIAIKKKSSNEIVVTAKSGEKLPVLPQGDYEVYRDGKLMDLINVDNQGMYLVTKPNSTPSPSAKRVNPISYGR